MAGSDLIAMAPWLVFGAGLGAICARLYVGGSRACRRRALRRPGVIVPSIGEPFPAALRVPYVRGKIMARHRRAAGGHGGPGGMASGAFGLGSETWGSG